MTLRRLRRQMDIIVSEVRLFLCRLEFMSHASALKEVNDSFVNYFSQKVILVNFLPLIQHFCNYA